ncbi:MAG: hypothetical protein ACRYGR_04525 [Janthinobacterium lividum]
MFPIKNKIIDYFSNFKISCLLTSGFVISILPSQATQIAPDSLESLTQITQQCRQQVDALWKAQRRVPADRRRDFHIAIGQASKSCDDLTDLLKQFEQAHALKQSYEKSFKNAQNLAQSSQETP